MNLAKAAWVAARRGPAWSPKSILTQLKAQLAHFKVPKRCVVVTELPRNAMGKVQKNVLRERYA